MQRTFVTLIIAALLIIAGCSSEKESTPTVPVTIDAPDRLTVAAQNPSSVQITWNDNSTGEDGFKLERKLIGANSWAVAATVAQDVESYLDTGLVEGAVYSYYVRAFDGGNFSASTDTLNAGLPLYSPANPSAVGESVLSAIFTWEDMSGAEANYRVERKAGNGRFGLVANLPANTVALHDSGLTANTQYTYRVRAIKDSLMSDWSDEASARTFQFPPNTPVQLRALLSGINAVQLNWRDNSLDEEGFRVQRSLAGSEDWQFIVELPAGSVSYLDTGLVEGTTYRYQVCSFIGGSNSGFAGPSGATTSLYSPGNLTAQRESETSISINWQNNSRKELGFQVRRKVGQSQYMVLGVTIPSGTLTMLDTGLTGDRTYTYQVRAVRDTISSNWSNEGSAHTTLVTPNPPADLTAEGGFGWPYEARLSWTDNSSGERNEEGFIVSKSPDGEDNWTVIDSTTADVTTFSVTNLPGETTWHFRVSSYNQFGTSTFSNVASCDIAGSPAGPTDLSSAGSAAAPGGAILRWTDNSISEAGFVIEISEDGTTGWAVHDSISANLVTFTVRNLPVETTRYFRIYAHNQVGRSSYSNVASSEVIGLPPPPTNLVGNAPDYLAVILDWQDNSLSENGFYIEKRNIESFTWRLLRAVGPNVVHFADSVVSPERSYVYRVRAHNDAGQTASTNEVTVNVPASPPVTPTNLTVTAIEIDQIEVGWYDRADNEDNYYVERRGPEEEDFTMVAILNADVNFFLDEGLIPESWYAYRVYAINSTGQSDYTPVDSAQTFSLLLYSEGFEAYDVDQPPPNWNQNVAGTSWDRVTTTRPHNGEKSLNFHDPDSGANHAWGYKSHSPLGIGTITAWLYIPDDSWFGYHGADPGFQTYTFRFFFMNNDSFAVLDGGAMVTYGSYPRDRWFKIDIDFHADSAYYVVYFDEEAVTPRCALPGSSPNGYVAGLAFSDRIVTDAFIDDIDVLRSWNPEERRNVKYIPRGRVIAPAPASINLGRDQFINGIRNGSFK